MKSKSLSLVMLLVLPSKSDFWGFHAHRMINRMAVFTLPVEMIGFYKHNIEYLTENAVNADRRRYAVKDEAVRHYIDIDYYGDSAIYNMPRYWKQAVEKYGEDTLRTYGIIPWYVYTMKYRLTEAMRIGDTRGILRLSADLGHYTGDAHVPLHTTLNYNGQLTGQHGIHGFWESRLTELFSQDYNFFVGKATYLEYPQLAIWKAVVGAHEALDSVLNLEKTVSLKFGDDKKYAHETRGGKTVKVYSQEFSTAYHDALQGMVERQMQRSIKLVGDFWYTCWIDAGQPDLNRLIDFEYTEEELSARKSAFEKKKQENVETRDHEH